MKISTFGRHCREGLKNLTRNAWMTFASLSAVTVTLLLLGVFLLLAYNVQQFSYQLENQVEMSVSVVENTDRAQVVELERQLKNLPGVASIKFVPKEEGLASLKNKLADNGQLLDGLEQDNPLPDVFWVKASDPQQTASLATKVRTLNHVEKVDYGNETVDQLFNVTELVRNAGAVFVIGLCFTALFLINNTIKVTIFARRKEIEIMKLCGATNWFIRWPFLIEGLLIGVFGSILPILALGIGYDYLTKSVPGIMLFRFADFDPLMFTVAGILLAIGALIGMIGSVMSISRFLRI
ncbi:cell division protein FtsX [Tumebacillus algifaecis]|uniref:Cell division protein FtsX n=1 Tax=Tumebacillus algifaecis TaxID=1214604 RepID=A0A223D566_9BACL|nr:permease-like cell division protein FtsX [Tumebacillus algifaecis]ASS76566.1 cell division protein FtsX [Tumebacillus algifaecis]